MVEEWEKESGIRVSRSAIAMAMRLHDVTPAHPRPRYDDMLPWHVKVEHALHSDAQLLRLEGRRRSGAKIPPRKLQWLTGWKTRLMDADAVIHYDPNTESGFFWVKRESSDDDIIRRPDHT